MENYSQSLILSLADLTEACLKLVVSKYLKNNPFKIDHYAKKYTDLDFDNIYKDQQEIISNLILEIYDLSESEKFYFFDCPFSVYENSYDWRLIFFLEEFKDSEDVDFLNNELDSLTTNFNKSHTIEFYYEYLDSDFKISNLIDDEAFNNSFIEINEWTIIINYSELVSNFTPFNASNHKKIKFIENKIKQIEVTSTPIVKTKLTINQLVILLDKMGLLSTPFMEKLPNTKKSDLISLITGGSKKNIKTAIEKLDKPQKYLGDNYQKDLDKVEKLISK